MIVVAVVLALVVAVVGVILAARLLGGMAGSGSVPTVESIRERPEEAWTYSYQGRDGGTDISGLVPVGERDFAGIFLSGGEDKPSRVALIDGETGEEAWSIPLESLGVDAVTAWPELLPVSPEGHLTVAVTDYVFDSTGELDWAATELHLVAINPVDGAVVSETVREGYAFSATEYSFAETERLSDTAPRVVVALRFGGVVRFDTSDLDGEMVWSANIEGVDGAEIVGDYVRVETDTTYWWLDADTGFEPDWFDGEGSGAAYLPTFESMILRFEYTESGIFYLDGLDESGDVLWTAEPDTFHTVASPEGRMLFFSESKEGDVASSHYLMRIDPLTGEEMWDREYEDSFYDLSRQTVSGHLVISDADRPVLIDAKTGERTHRLRGAPMMFAADVLYTVDEDQLRAWNPDSGEELWSLRLRSGGEVLNIGSMLLTVDGERGQFTRLR
ncbi:hypothetical protein GCM10023160_33620 [Brachybacterium paraconglomeratum]